MESIFLIPIIFKKWQSKKGMGNILEINKRKLTIKTGLLTLQECNAKK